jgi:hypothetical protein
MPAQHTAASVLLPPSRLACYSIKPLTQCGQETVNPSLLQPAPVASTNETHPSVHAPAAR